MQTLKFVYITVTKKLGILICSELFKNVLPCIICNVKGLLMQKNRKKITQIRIVAETEINFYRNIEVLRKFGSKK